MWSLLLRYHPGPLLLCAAAMGIGVMLPHTFLRPYTAELDIPRIRTFFFVYAVVAFGVRIVTRRFTDRFGVRLTTQLGFGFMTLSMLAFIFVRSELMLAIPASLGGVAHAFLFPAIVTGGSMSFPTQHRGLATTLVLSMFDLSNLVGQPAIGAVVDFAPAVSLPGFPTMFVLIATAMAAAGLIAGLVKEPRDDGELDLELTSEGSLDCGEERRELVEVG